MAHARIPNWDYLVVISSNLNIGRHRQLYQYLLYPSRHYENMSLFHENAKSTKSILHTVGSVSRNIKTTVDWELLSKEGSHFYCENFTFQE